MIFLTFFSVIFHFSIRIESTKLAAVILVAEVKYSTCTKHETIEQSILNVVAHVHVRRYALKNNKDRDKKTVLSQGNRAMPQLFFSV